MAQGASCCGAFLAADLSIAGFLAQALHDEFEVDFVSLSFARTADDVVQAREFLDSVGLTTTKARPALMLAWLCM